MLDIGSEICDACEFALAELNVAKADVLATLVFGSRAKGLARAASDFDLIFFLKNSADHPAFQYRQLRYDRQKLDVNVIKPHRLGELCAADIGWAYRLHRPQPVPELTQAPMQMLERWIAQLNTLIESDVACRMRLIRHLRDSRRLAAGAVRASKVDPKVATYLAMEAMFLVPMIFLSGHSCIPFAKGVPWDEALDFARGAESDETHGYLQLFTAIAGSRFYQSLNGDRAFGVALKGLRGKCRELVIGELGNLFHDDFGAHLGDQIMMAPDLRQKLQAALCSYPDVEQEALDAISNWLSGTVRGIAATKSKRLKISRRKSRRTGARFMQYDQAVARLKIILPTGGCRVPTCHFCMLPYMARSRADVGEVIAEASALCRNQPVEQVTVYTDGSFFDERELAPEDQLLIAQRARDFGAAELLVESLPRFLNEDKVGRLVDALGPDCRLRIGVGLQSTNALIRQHITGTPIAQHELDGLVRWRRTAPFSLRIYLLANKPLLLAAEDREDLHRSLAFLDDWLESEDVVTINPLLPTTGTLVERIEGAGFWRPFRSSEFQDFSNDLHAQSYRFRLEIGPPNVATCTDHEAIDGAETQLAPDMDYFSGSAHLPWSIMGGFHHRGQWAVSGGFA